MPHFKTHCLKLPKLPHTTEEFTFQEFFTSTTHPNFALLQVRFHAKHIESQPQEFFLEIKKDSTYTLVRFDKYSRIAPIEIIKNALRILMGLQDSIITHNLNPNTIAPEHKLPFIKTIDTFLDFDALMVQKSAISQKKFSKLWLEIGFGSGRHLLHNAQQYREILHIGLEIHYPSLEQVARQIELQKLDNLLILAYDARIFLELLPSNTLDKIFVHFPIPWDKKPHRRIFSLTFLTQAARTLKLQGHLQLRTDSLKYFTFTKNLANSLTQVFKVESHINTQETITSKYEARWLRANKDIYNLECYALQEHPKCPLDFNFDFCNTTLNFHAFKPVKCVKDSYFLHLGDLFLGEKSKLLKVTMGDFNASESRYILQDSHLMYFKNNPLPTNSNHKAHELLLETLAHL